MNMQPIAGGRWLSVDSYSFNLSKILKPIRRQLGIPRSVLDILMPQVVLNCPRILSIVRQLEPAGVAQHVGMSGEIETGPPPSPGDQLAAQTLSKVSPNDR